MKLRILLMFPLAIALAFMGTTTAAQAGMPGIRNTAEYKALKSYVKVLASKSANPNKVGEYRRTLSAKRAKANSKVRDRFQERRSTAKMQRTKARAKVAKMRQNRSAEVQALKSNRDAKLSSLEQQRRSGVSRINSEYGDRLDNLAKNRAELTKKLAKAKGAAARQRIRDELDDVQSEINSLDKEKQNDLSLLNTRINNQEQTVKEKAAADISRTKAQVERDIQEAEQALRERYEARSDAAKTARQNEFAIVKAEYERGVAFINALVKPKPEPKPEPAPEAPATE